MSPDAARIVGYLPALLGGAWTTIVLSLVSIAVASGLGLLIAGARVSRVWALRTTASSLIAVVRNTPELVQLYLVFYALPATGIVLPPFGTAVLVLGGHYGVYLSEVFRGGIASIDRTQWEAARVLGITRIATWTRIVLPQAIRRVLPAWGNYLLIMFKATALAGVITVQELFFRANDIAAANFRFFEVWTLAAAIYLPMGVMGSIAVRRLERHLARSESTLRRTMVIGQEGPLVAVPVVAAAPDAATRRQSMPPR